MMCNNPYKIGWFALVFFVSLVLIPLCAKANEYSTCDYFAYCDKHLFEKVVLHTGGSTYFGLVAKTFEHDPVLAVATATAPGFAFEVVQHFQGESLLSNAFDTFMWDMGGAITGVLLSDLLWPEPKKR
jgi:hypothetical protein